MGVWGRHSLPDSVSECAFYGVGERLFADDHLAFEFEGGIVEIVGVDESGPCGLVGDRAEHGKIADVHMHVSDLCSEGEVLDGLVTGQDELLRSDVYPATLGQGGTGWHKELARCVEHALEVGIAEQVGEVEIAIKFERAV